MIFSPRHFPVTEIKINTKRKMIEATHSQKEKEKKSLIL